MGTIVDAAGISLQLYDDEGRPLGDPHFGKYALLAGLKRADIARAKPLTAAESNEPGSEDWLTLVAVADTEARLEQILRETAVRRHDASYSSAGSWRVLVEMHVGDMRARFENRVTIASGPFIVRPNEPILMSVTHVKVLAEDTVMDDKHRLFPEFKGAGPWTHFATGNPVKDTST
jgi:hypothetical protein